MVNTKKRKRGGASYACPMCGGNTRVVNTRRRTRHVWRIRECKTRTCKARITTEERGTEK